MRIFTAQVEKQSANRSGRESTGLSSHLATALIELVPIDNRLDVLPRSGKIDVLEELLHRYIGNVVSTAPSLGATGAGVVLRQRERKRINLMFPVFDRTMQIPTARLQVGFRIEKLFHLKARSEEHTSELQSRVDLVCRLLLEKKKKKEHKQKQS